MRSVASGLVGAPRHRLFWSIQSADWGQVPPVKKIVSTLLPLLAFTAFFIVLSIITFLLFMLYRIAGG